MAKSHFIVFSALVAICAGQRSPYAGKRPIGFPVIETTTSANSQNNSLGNRFGEQQNVTTEALPVEALGDREFFNSLGKVPQDNQPFWYINRKPLEENRKNLQTYPIRPSVFINPDRDLLIQPDTNSVNAQIPSQNNPISNQTPIQNNQFVSSISQPGNNTGLSNQPIENNQIPSNNQQTVQNNVAPQNNQLSTAT